MIEKVCGYCDDDFCSEERNSHLMCGGCSELYDLAQREKCEAILKAMEDLNPCVDGVYHDRVCVRRSEIKQLLTQHSPQENPNLSNSDSKSYQSKPADTQSKCTCWGVYICNHSKY